MAATVGKYDYKATSYGFTAPVGAATVFLLGGKGTISGASGDINNYKQIQYGVRYALGKRSTVYIAGGTTKDDAQSSTSTGNAKSTYSAFGLMHAF
jgi:predicted porin